MKPNADETIKGVHNAEDFVDIVYGSPFNIKERTLYPTATAALPRDDRGQQVGPFGRVFYQNEGSVVGSGAATDF